MTARCLPTLTHVLSVQSASCPRSLSVADTKLRTIWSLIFIYSTGRNTVLATAWKLQHYSTQETKWKELSTVMLFIWDTASLVTGCWCQMETECHGRLRLLNAALSELESFDSGVSEFDSWLSGAESQLRILQRSVGDLHKFHQQTTDLEVNLRLISYTCNTDVL